MSSKLIFFLQLHIIIFLGGQHLYYIMLKINTKIFNSTQTDLL